MSWVIPAAIAGSSILGGLAASKSGKAQAQAAGEATQLQGQMFNVARGHLQPWLDTGNLALSDLSAMLRLGDSTRGNVNDQIQGSPLLHQFGVKDFEESPAYQFNLQQGQKAIEKAAAARKTFYAPQTLQDIGRFSQGLASNEFQNAFNNYNTNMNNVWNRLYSLSGSGQNAGAQLGAFGANAANAMGDNITGRNFRLSWSRSQRVLHEPDSLQ
jgi:hypothetical protein